MVKAKMKAEQGGQLTSPPAHAVGGPARARPEQGAGKVKLQGPR